MKCICIYTYVYIYADRNTERQFDNTINTFRPASGGTTQPQRLAAGEGASVFPLAQIPATLRSATACHEGPSICSFKDGLSDGVHFVRPYRPTVVEPCLHESSLKDRETKQLNDSRLSGNVDLERKSRIVSKQKVTSPNDSNTAQRV